MSVADLLAGLLPDDVVGVRAERVVVDMPVELQIGSLAARVIEGSGPTQDYRTSLMPVLHRIRVTFTIEADDGR